MTGKQTAGTRKSAYLSIYLSIYIYIHTHTYISIHIHSV